MNKHLYWGTGNQLPKETVQITRELGDVTFVGATAVFFHIKSDRSRGTHDIDFAVAREIPDEELREKGYMVIGDGKNKRRWTPRNLKIDIFTDSIGDIPVKNIIRRAKTIPVGNSGVNRIKIASLEDLIITKFRANRDQDNQDLSEIAYTKYDKINWPLLQSLTKDEVEFTNIKNIMKLSRR